MFFHPSPWKSHNMPRSHFSKKINLRGHMPRFTFKMNIFPPISLETNYNVCWNPQNRVSFSKDNWIEGSHALVYSQKWTFCHLSPWKPHICVLKPSEQGSIFPKQLISDVNMSRFTWNMNVFPSNLLRNHVQVCWNPQNRACLPKTINLSGCLGLLETWMSSYLSPWKPHTCVDDTLRTGLDFLRQIDFDVSHA